MTSNLGSSVIQEMVGDAQGRASVAGGVTPGSDRSNYVEMKDAVMEIVGQHFRPEFINRVDEAVVFHPLGQGQIRAICKIQIELLTPTFARKRHGYGSQRIGVGFYLARLALTRYMARGL